MLTRLALVAVLTATGAALPGAEAPAQALTDAPTTVAQVAAVGTYVRAALPALPAADAAAEDVTVTELDVVVPSVDASGEVMETPDLAAAQAEEDVIATDEVVADRVLTEVVEAGDFQTVGVTWPADAEVGDPEIEVRTRAEGEWSAWVPVEAGGTAPDPGTADAGSALRSGTDSLWVGDADAVQLSFPASAEGGPADMALTLVDVPAVDTAAAQVSGVIRAENAVFWAGRTGRTTASVLSTALMGTEPTGVGVPVAAPALTVITREQWGARAQVCTPDVATTNGLIGAVVHHTAGSNTYSTVAQAMQQIRGDQAYHIDGRGWCDIGYNFVVDKWGNIYEGRAYSLTQPVIGVHAGGFNTGTVGVSMLGTYGDPPPDATVDSVGRIIGTRLAAYDIDARGSFVYNTLGGENSRYPAGTAVPLARVFTHRDVAYTACPGNGGWASLGTVRVIAGTYMDSKQYVDAGSVVKALYQDLLGRGPEDAGLQGWRSVLLNTGDQSGLVATLTSSDEYLMRRIRQAYVEVLGREPEPTGSAGWLAAIRQGRATVDDVQRTFYDSIEYFATSGGTPEGYVARLYTTMLDRPAQPSEIATWVNLYHVRGRAWVVDSIWWSAEAAERRAGIYYQTFLGRAPDLPGVQAWGRVLLVQGEGAVRAGIAGSLEYRGRAISRFP